MTAPLSDYLATMTRAAEAAGEGLAEKFTRLGELRVERKNPSDFVSEADLEAERSLFETLKADWPDIGALLEEGGIVEGEDDALRWVVDPLDGTTNFLHGLPHWAISIALEHKGEIVSAVIFDPSKDEMFVAEKGQGAWLNESRLRVSDRRRMIESVFATGLPFGGRRDLPETLQDLARIMPQVAGVRRFGSAALDLAYVAAGRYEGYWERGLNSWDMAAGLLLVREAGGFVEAIVPERNPLETGDVVCANPLVFDTFAKTVRNG